MNTPISTFVYVSLMIVLMVSSVFVSLIAASNIPNAPTLTLLSVSLLTPPVIGFRLVLIMIKVIFYSAFVLLMAPTNSPIFFSTSGIFLLPILSILY